MRDVLWADDGVRKTTSTQQRERMRAEEMQIVVAAVRSDPWGQLRASARNFAAQLGRFGMQGSYYPDPYIESRIEEALPGSADRFSRSRQARRVLHEEFFGGVQRATVTASLVAIALCGALLGRARSRRLTALAVLVLAALLANAAITGAIAEIEDRYQARVIWLVPLLATIVVLSWQDLRLERRALQRGRGSARPLIRHHDSSSTPSDAIQSVKRRTSAASKASPSRRLSACATAKTRPSRSRIGTHSTLRVR